MTSPVARIGMSLAVVLTVGLVATNASQVTLIRVLGHAALATPFLVWCVARGTFWRAPQTGICSIAIAAYLVAAAASGTPLTSLETLGMPILLVGAYSASATGGGSIGVRRIVAAAVVVTASVWLVAIGLGWLFENIEWIALGGGLPDTEPLHAWVWVTGNAVPLLALMAAPFFAELEHGPVPRVLRIMFVAAAAFVIPQSGGATAFAAIVVAALVYLALASPRWRRVSCAVAGAINIGLAILPLVRAAGVDSLPSSLEAKLIVWEQAAHVLAASPWLGSGPGTIAVARLDFVEEFASPVLTTHVHSALLQAAAEGGIIVLAAMATVALGIVRLVVLHRDSLTHRHRVTIAALVGLATASMTDSFHELPVLYLLAAVLIGWMTRDLSGVMRAPAISRRRATKVVVLAALILTVPAVVVADLARIAADAGRAATRSDDLSAANDAFALSRAFAPENPAYSLSGAATLAAIGDDTGAAAAYARALQLNPNDARAAAGLAESRAGEERIELLRTAATNADGDPQYAWRWAEALRAADNPDAAQAYAHALLLESTWSTAARERAEGNVERLDTAVTTVLGEFGDKARVDQIQVKLDYALAAGDLPANAPAAWLAMEAVRTGKTARASQLAADAVVEGRWDFRSWRALALTLPCHSVERDRALELGERTSNAFTRFGIPTLRRWERQYGVPPLGDYQPPLKEALPSLTPWPGLGIGERCD